VSRANTVKLCGLACLSWSQRTDPSSIKETAAKIQRHLQINSEAALIFFRNAFLKAGSPAGDLGLGSLSSSN